MGTLTNADIVRLDAENLVRRAEAMGVSLTITREPLQPLAMGHARHVVDAWPARTPAAAVQPSPWPISDREWAAIPSNLREGCTVHIPGVGDI
jgi:hypothetical protein